MEITRHGASRLRALVTEMLPYELPLEASTPWLYNWVNQKFVGMDDEAIRLAPRSSKDLLLLALLSGEDPTTKPITAAYGQPRPQPIPLDLLSLITKWRASNVIEVRRDKTRLRRLDLLSVGSQLSLAVIYSRYKDVILHHNGKSRYTLRAPAQATPLGRHIGTDSRTDQQLSGPSVETIGRRLGTYNSFFNYKRYAFIGEFYDSPEWNALEAKWIFLRRLDVANCFKSVYTHSISWATSTRTYSKAHLGNRSSLKDYDFANIIDKAMQSANWGETHGIPIGPEASRIFAETIFQRIDNEIQSHLYDAGIKSKDYEILRYVDDYFIFATKMSTIESVSAIVDSRLAEYGFHVNESKTKDYETPFTTETSIKKADLKIFLKTALPGNLEPEEGKYKDALPFDAREINVKLKSALVGLEHDAVAVGSSLTQIDLQLRKALKIYPRAPQSTKDALFVHNYIWEFVKSMVYQYLTSPSVSSALKVVRTLWNYKNTTGTYLENRGSVGQRLVDETISERLRFSLTMVLDRLLTSSHNNIEICHFLSLATATGVQFDPKSRIFEKLITRLDHSAPSISNYKTDHSNVFLLLSAVKYFFHNEEADSNRYHELLAICEKYCSAAFSQAHPSERTFVSTATQELLLLSLIDCPYFDPKDLFELLHKPWVKDLINTRIKGPQGNKVNCTRFIKNCLKANNTGHKFGSFAWDKVDFTDLLRKKEAQFVY